MTTINFNNAQVNNTIFIASPYTESGFTFTASDNSATGFFSPSLTGQYNQYDPSIRSLSNSNGGGTETLTAQNGTAFSINSIDVDSLFYGQNNQTVTFTATSANGPQTASFSVDQTEGFQRFTFGSSFSNVTSVSFSAQNAPFYQFDNVVVNAGAAAPCYCTGTRILTDRGEIAVEYLAIGDVIVTTSGEHRSIKWIGCSIFDAATVGTNPHLRPIRVAASALADGVPTRDLWVSPAHALYLDGMLIAAEHLINGTTIVRAQAPRAVTYWHVELATHDLLVAEGAVAESFRDDGAGRRLFQNVATFAALYGHDGPTVGDDCAPRVTCGKTLAPVHVHLEARAALIVSDAKRCGAFNGYIDIFDGRRIAGWARDEGLPDAPVCLDVVVDGSLVTLVLAKHHRADVEAAGHGRGFHGFELDLSVSLDPQHAHTLEVRRSVDGEVLGRRFIEPTFRVAA